MSTALVIDDDAALAAVIAQFLTSAGFAVETATSGQEGLRKAISIRPTAVIVDVMMPDMDGYEVCRRLRRDPRTGRAVIVVLTARGQPVDRQMALRVGADAHWPKPFRGKELAQQVQQLVADRRCAAPLPGCQVLLLRLKEGVGATMLATNLGLCLAGEKGCQTTLVDLVAPAGQVGERLGLATAGGWPDPAAGDVEALASCLVRHEQGLFVLAGPQESVATGEDVAWLLQTLREWSDYLILDTPLHLGALTPVLMRSSALVLLVLTPEPGILHKAQVSITALRRTGDRALSVWPVLNMMTPDDHRLQQEAEELWGESAVVVLPWSPEECAPAVGGRRPIVLSHAESPLATAIQALARRIVWWADERRRSAA